MKDFHGSNSKICSKYAVPLKVNFLIEQLLQDSIMDLKSSTVVEVSINVV